MKTRNLAIAIAIGMSSTGALAEECGNVTIANMNWASATLMANVDAFILEHGFGCRTEIVPGDTMPTGTSMIERGQPDIAPEFWTNNFKEALARGVEEGRLQLVGQSLSDGGEEGFWVPRYMVEKHPELATIEGVMANAELFPHPESRRSFGFYGCPSGWGCQISSTNLFNALDLESAGFDYVDPGSGAALAGAIARAYERGQGWFGYYWAPTSVLGKYEMVKVDLAQGSVDEQHFVDCISQADCVDPRPTNYIPSPVWTVTTTAFAERMPLATEYLATRSFTNADMNVLLAWIEDNQADGDVAMEHFMKNNEDTWRTWLPAEAADRVAAAVANLR
ncbi:MAG TPA: glycine betaine ABC transporter substrate-binding protein [Azoarcus taiwanensis]|nr:glycine betaine ABC transporter substrate-binding protein [Azoarcus taiwanensis]